jgi:hypothetical protein
MSSREDGYYWCRDDVYWMIARWYVNKWHLIGCPYDEDDDYWDEINETPISINAGE